MLKRALFCLLTLLALAFVTSPVVADPPSYAHPNADWLTWELQDAAGDQISLTGYQSQSTFVVIFSVNDDDACTLIRDLAEHVREHPTDVGKVLALCSNDTGAKALKLHIRQEEYAKRVAEWEEDQATAKAAAELADEHWTPEPVPDFVAEIENELDDPNDLADLMDYHFPFNTACRCSEMWEWLSERMATPVKAPRALKISSTGAEQNEWSGPSFNVQQILGS
jgi:hypothetical protein